MKLVKLTHANLKRDGKAVVVYVPATSIGGFHHSPAHACTHVYTVGPHVFPAAESCEEIERRVAEDSVAVKSSAPRRGK